MGFTGNVTATDTTDGVRVLTVPNDIDVYTAPELRQAGIEAVAGGHFRIVIDLTGVTYMDSTGLGVLVGMLKRASTYGGWVRLACMPAAVERVFRTTGLLKTFVIADTVADAINHTEGATAP